MASTIAIEQPGASLTLAPNGPSPSAAETVEGKVATCAPSDAQAAASDTIPTTGESDTDMAPPPREPNGEYNPTNRADGWGSSCDEKRRSSHMEDARALAEKRLQIQIAYAENARRLIECERHPDLLERFARLQVDHEARLQRASIQEEYWQHCAAIIFNYECEEANNEFLTKCEKLRQDMLEEIQSEMDIISDQSKGATSARKTTRKTRSSRGKNGTESPLPFSFDSAEKIKKRSGTVFRPLEKKLAQSEVDQDLRELHAAFDASKKRRLDANGMEANPFARTHRSKFLFGELILEEGDEIYVQNQVNGRAYVAVICVIASTELIVLSEKGMYHRLMVMDIRQGKIVVDILTAEQSDALLADQCNSRDRHGYPSMA